MEFQCITKTKNMSKFLKSAALLLFIASFTSSCVSKKKFVDLEAQKSAVELKYDRLSTDNNKCEDDKAALQTQLENMKAQMSISEAQFKSDLIAKDEKLKIISEELDYNKKTNTNLLDRLSDLSVISKAGAESVKTSLESLNQQSQYIQDLSADAKRKDSLNLALVMNLKRSLSEYKLMLRKELYLSRFLISYYLSLEVQQ